MTSASPQVSVVITAIRGGRWLEEAVSSVLEQTFANFELIVVDDGTPVDVHYLAGWDSRVRVVPGLGAGTAMARNVGNALARGELIAVLDDDDRWLPGKLDRQLALLERHADAGMCHTQFELIDESGAVTGPGWGGSADLSAILRGDAGVLHSTTLWRKRVIQALGGYNPTTHPCSDADLLLRTAGRWPIVYEPSVLVQYRRHEGQESGNNHYREVYRQMCHVYADHLPRIAAMQPRRMVAAPRVGRRVFVQMAAEEAIRSVKAGRHSAAVGHVAWALRTDLVFMARFLASRAISRIMRRWRGIP